MINIDWETRAKVRRIENKELKKRIKELIISRDEWKVKYMKQKGVLNEMKTKVGVIKKNIQHILNI